MVCTPREWVALGNAVDSERLSSSTQVIGDVPRGSAVTAGHSIYVTGSLHGEAIAGLSGDKDARVFSVRSLVASHTDRSHRQRVRTLLRPCPTFCATFPPSFAVPPRSAAAQDWDS